MFRVPQITAAGLTFLLLLLIHGQGFPAGQTVVPACRELKWTGQSHASSSLSWITPQTTDKQKLDEWCATVGPALFRSPEQPRSRGNGRILLVDWNVHVGNGNIEALIEELVREERKAGRSYPDFVFLLQEAFRRSADVPSQIRLNASVPSRIPSPPNDIDALGRKLDWWVFYVPSMRNGEQRGGVAEDRGNAILSTLPLEALQAVELPFSVQRRVVASAIVHDDNRNIRFRVATVHLDTRAPLSRGLIFGAASARNGQARWIANIVTEVSGDGLSLVLGGDLNSYLGPLESAADTLGKVAPRLDCGKRATHVTGFILDYIFARFSTSRIEPVSCWRLESRFESDHYPLVLPLSPNPAL